MNIEDNKPGRVEDAKIASLLKVKLRTGEGLQRAHDGLLKFCKFGDCGTEKNLEIVEIEKNTYFSFLQEKYVLCC